MSLYLFGVLHGFQHCTGHITTGSWKGRGNQYIEFIRVLYCKLLTNGKQLPAVPLEAVSGTEPRPQGWEARGPFIYVIQLAVDSKYSDPQKLSSGSLLLTQHIGFILMVKFVDKFNILSGA